MSVRVRWIKSSELLWIIQRPRSTLHSLLQDEVVPIPNWNGRPLRWTEASLREWAANPPAEFNAADLKERLDRVCFFQDYHAALEQDSQAS